MIRRRGLTLIGIAVTNLDNDRAVQLRLPFDRHGAADAGRRRRRGARPLRLAAVMRAVMLGRDPGWSMPMLPD